MENEPTESNSPKKEKKKKSNAEVASLKRE